MKKIFYSLSIIAVCCFTAVIAKAQFTSGNIVVLQAGDGTAALSNLATPVILKEYTTGAAAQTTPVSFVAIPVSGAGRLTIGGTTSSEGFLTLSKDSLRLVLAGYDTGSTGVSPSGVSSANLARTIDTLSILGIPGKAVSTNIAYSAGSFRSAVRSDLENYWGSGSTGGTYYFGLLNAASSIQTTVNNNRVNGIFNGNIYFSSGSGTLGIYKLTGLPTSASVPVNMIATGTSSSPYGFAVNSSETIVYVADDRTTNNAGGIQKWVYNSTTSSWGTTAADTLTVGTNIGARGMAVDWSGIYPAIYVTTTDNRLVKVIDSALAQNTYVTLATAPANTAFRSVAFVPHAVCVNPVLSAAVTNYTCSGNGAITLSVTSGSTPTSYSWTGPGTFTASTQNLTNLQAGTYIVTATAAGGCSTTYTAVVANNATALATATAQGLTTFCAGGSVVLKANTATGNTYIWSKNGVAIVPAATDSIYTATTVGSYTVTVTSGPNCTATSSAVVVTVNPLPSSTLTAAGPTTFCTGGSVQLCAPASGGNTYQWSLNGTAITSASGNCITASSTGTYCVTVAAIATGCTSSSCTPVTVGAPPSATITPAGPVAICQGSSIVLHTNHSAGLTYQWYKNGTAVTPNGTDSILSVTAAGSYTVTVSSSATCFSTSAAVVVTVNALPIATITPATAQTICQGQTVSFTANTGTGLTYQYLNGTSNITGATNAAYTFTGAAAGIIQIAVKVTDANSCSATSPAVAVTVNAKPVASITSSADTVCQHDLITLTAPSGTGLTYHWIESIIGVLPSINSSIQVTGVAFGGGNGYVVDSYRVVITNASGCTDTSGWKKLAFRPLPSPVITNTGGVLSTTQSYTSYQWLQDGLVVNGATSQQYTPVSDGTYNVIVSDGYGCSDTALSGQIISGLNVRDVAARVGLKVYPNPASDLVHIEAAVTVNVSLRDVQGRVVMTQDNASMLDISKLADGVYLLCITDARGGFITDIRLIKRGQ